MPRTTRPRVRYTPAEDIFIAALTLGTIHPWPRIATLFHTHFPSRTAVNANDLNSRWNHTLKHDERCRALETYMVSPRGGWVKGEHKGFIEEAVRVLKGVVRREERYAVEGDSGDEGEGEGEGEKKK